MPSDPKKNTKKRGKKIADRFRTLYTEFGVKKTIKKRLYLAASINI